MTDTKKIKEKIKKLFALSKSPNAHEASLALERAQKLMAEYGIERKEVGEFEIIEEKIKGNGGKNPPRYEVYLAVEIANAFGCRCAYGTVNKKSKTFYGSEYYDYEYGHIFVGLEHRVQIASFIAEVLVRKLKNARRDYIKTLKRVRLRGNKIKRADEFCLGWVHTVTSKLRAFTNTPGEQADVDRYTANLGWGDGLKTIKRKSGNLNDFINGRLAAAGVRIQHGMEGREGGAPLLENV
jgi:hypothetical protein